MKKLLVSIILLTLIISHPKSLVSINKKSLKSLSKSSLMMENVVYQSNSKQQKGILCVIPVKDKEGLPSSIWLLIHQKSFYNVELGRSLAGMSNVSDIKVSADSKYLAIHSVGEGHPIIEVIDLQLLLIEKKVKTLKELNPYPGFMLSIVGWKKNLLVFKSQMLMTHYRDGKIDSALQLFSVETFYLNVTTGKITPGKRILKTPVKYYAKQLNNSKKENRLSAIHALISLKSASAIPYLKKAHKHEKNSDVKKLLEKAITSLKK